MFIPEDFEALIKLYCAVIERAILDLDYGRGTKSDDNRKALIRQRAAYWIKNRSEEEFSFNWTCRTIGFDPDKIREKVLSAEPGKRLTILPPGNYFFNR